MPVWIKTEYLNPNTPFKKWLLWLLLVRLYLCKFLQESKFENVHLKILVSSNDLLPPFLYSSLTSHLTIWVMIGHVQFIENNCYTREDVRDSSVLQLGKADFSIRAPPINIVWEYSTIAFKAVSLVHGSGENFHSSLSILKIRKSFDILTFCPNLAWENVLKSWKVL